MTTKVLSERPLKVAHAVKIFYVIVGIGIIRVVMTIIRHADVRSPYFLIFTKLELCETSVIKHVIDTMSVRVPPASSRVALSLRNIHLTCPSKSSARELPSSSSIAR